MAVSNIGASSNTTIEINLGYSMMSFTAVEQTVKEIERREKKGSLDNGSRLAKKLRRLGWIPQRQKTIRGTNG